MMRSVTLLACLLATSCDRSDYVIDVERANIERVDRLGGSGYIVVDRASAETMAKYGDVYLRGRSCPQTTCRTFEIGILDKYNAMPVRDGVRLNLEPVSVPQNDAQYPPFWLRNVACVQVEAVQGFMGRTGRSDWNCSVTRES